MHEAPPAETEWRDAIHQLSSFERPSASDGERRAAEWIGARLRARGLQTEIEREDAHGGYWWPLGLANLLAAAGARAARGPGIVRRVVGGVAAGVAAAAVWDEVSGGRLWFRRRLLPSRATWNVIARGGDSAATRTLVVLGHHDAAHSGLIFHPALPRIGPRLMPRLHERTSHTLPVLYGVWLGPALICAGALMGGRRLLQAGAVVALGASATMANIGAADVVPGANDNLSAVGALIAVADELRRRPSKGLRVLLVSTGSEESFMEGMQGFAKRHFAELDPAQTEFLCLECLGGPILSVLEGEGMLRMRDYPWYMRESLAEAAKSAGVKITRGLRTVAATDALIALRAGYPVVTLASVDETKFPLNYHWPTDAPDALHWRTIEDAIAVCIEFLRARSSPSSA